MTAFDDLRDDALGLYVTLTQALAGRLPPARAELLAGSRDQLVDTRYTVAVCGEFKRGKSSLLNALVERPGLFPVDADITTAVTTSLSYGPKETATVHFAGDGEETPPPPLDVGLDQVEAYVTEQDGPRHHGRVAGVAIQAPVGRLAGGMTLVDTPGIGSLNPAHTLATESALSVADAIVFVVSAVEPPSTSELEFLRDALRRCPTVVTAVTMTDRVADPRPVIAEARTRVAAVARRAPASLAVVGVSSFRKLDALEDDDPALEAASGFPELEEALWDGLAANLGAARVRHLLDGMRDALAEVADPVRHGLATLHRDAGTIQADLRKLRESRDRLTSGAPGWQQQIRTDIDQATRPVLRQLDADLDGVADEFREGLRAGDAVRDAQRLISRATSAMIAAGQRAGEGLAAAFEQVASDYAALTELPLALTWETAGDDPFSVTVQAPPMPSHAKIPFTTARQIWSMGVSLGGLGAFIGSALMPGPGTAAGASIGGVAGLAAGMVGAVLDLRTTSREHKRREYAGELRAVVLDKLSSGRRHLARDIDGQIRDHSAALVRQLQQEIAARAESLGESIRVLETGSRQDSGTREERERALRQELNEIAGVGAALGRLRSRADALASPPRAARETA